MTHSGLWIPRKLRAPKIHQLRYRRACIGELVQIDGCDHHWFEGRGPACTLLVYVDDATSRLMMLSFVHSESTFTYLNATRAYLERHGRPLAFYSDKASVFRINNPHAHGGSGQTQFGRALETLNITGICANCSQTKGRVERAHLTLQDRLVKELLLRNISTPEDGNNFADEYMGDYNRRVKTLQYMRVKAALPGALWKSGNFYPAMAHCREMLQLNPNDNHGIRHSLTNYYLELEMVDDLVLILDDYSGDMRPFLQYTRALLAYRDSSPEANDIAKAAIDSNRHIPVCYRSEDCRPSLEVDISL